MSIVTRSPLRRRLRNRPGQGLVEFALIAPILLLLMFGLVEFARAWNIRHVLTDAAREGARTLVVDNGISDDSVRAIVRGALARAGVNPAQASITLDNGGGTTGQPARVSITYNYTLGIARAFLGWAVQDATFQLGSTFVMRNE